MKYLTDMTAYADQKTVSDKRLANDLMHGKDTTTILLVVEYEDEQYALELCGQLCVYDMQSCTQYRAKVPSSVIDVLESRPEGMPYELEDDPWFQWVDSFGDPVGDITDRISLNPADEINHLLAILDDEEETMPC